MHSFTTEDLIQFVYNESSIQKSAAIKIALESDFALRENYQEIFAAHQSMEMEKTMYSPSKKAIDKILAYAKDSVTQTTTTV